MLQGVAGDGAAASRSTGGGSISGHTLGECEVLEDWNGIFNDFRALIVDCFEAWTPSFVLHPGSSIIGSRPWSLDPSGSKRARNCMMFHEFSALSPAARLVFIWRN